MVTFFNEFQLAYYPLDELSTFEQAMRVAELSIAFSKHFYESDVWSKGMIFKNSAIRYLNHAKQLQH